MCDVEPGLVHWLEPDELQEKRIRDLALFLTPETRLLWVTNSHRQAPRNLRNSSSLYIRSARKPWVRPWHRVLENEIAVVIGDLMTIDGILAWRYGFPFILVSQPGQAPVWPRVLGLIGTLVRPLFAF